jgi:hypothetical protein
MSDLTYVDPSHSRSLFTRGFVLAGTTRPHGSSLVRCSGTSIRSSRG